MGGRLFFSFLVINFVFSSLKSSSLDMSSSLNRSLPFCSYDNMLTQCSTENSFRLQPAVSAVDVFNELNSIQPDRSFSMDNMDTSLIIVLFHSSMIRASTMFMDKTSSVTSRVQYMSFLLDNENVDSNSIQTIVNVFIDNRNNISTVVMFIEENSSVDGLLNEVSNTRDLILSGVIHSTEWFIVSPNNETFLNLQENEPNIDFITVVFQFSQEVTCVAQKSRNETFRLVNQKHDKLELSKNCRCNNFEGEFVSHRFYSEGEMRKSALLFLRSQKSTLSGMTLPVGWIDSEHYKLATLNRTGNVTTCGGYSGSLLKLLAASLGFTFDFVPVTDGQQYGFADGLNSSGMLGILTRRQAALTTLPISCTQARDPLIHCVPVVTFRDQIFITYRVSEPVDAMDLIYLSIIEPAFLYIHAGPLVLLVLISALVYVVTKSCSSKHPVPLSRSQARRLLTFPAYTCFHDSMIYPGQAGRILRATWSIFWFIMCSAYVAFLATTFTVKPEEVPINTFQKLSDAKDFKIGTASTTSALLYALFGVGNQSMHELWQKIINQNRTDNNTLDVSVDNHAKRVLQGHYAFVSGFCITLGACDDILLDYFTEIRAYALNINGLTDKAFVATPKNIFYDRELYKVLLNFEEMGILDHLMEIHFRPRLRDTLYSNKINDASDVVTFSRILLPVYTSLAGVGVSALCLGLEIVYGWWKFRGRRV